MLTVERSIFHQPVLNVTSGLSLVVLLLALLAPGSALAQSYTNTSSTGNVDDRALAIENELQCPVCENVTVAYSNSALAGQMRQVIRDKLAQGQSRDEIVQYFVDRYGEGILTQPPKHGLNLVVWLLPVSGLLIGLGAIGTVLLSKRPTALAPVETRLSEEDERLLADALGGT